MLAIKEKGIIINIIRHCYRIETKIKGLSFESFCNDEDVKEIVSFNILQIGELVKNLSLDFLKKYSDMPWKDIKGMRDWVAHGYGTINLKEVWDTSINDIKLLKDYCEIIVNEN